MQLNKSGRIKVAKTGNLPDRTSKSSLHVWFHVWNGELPVEVTQNRLRTIYDRRSCKNLVINLHGTLLLLYYPALLSAN